MIEIYLTKYGEFYLFERPIEIMYYADDSREIMCAVFEYEYLGEL